MTNYRNEGRKEKAEKGKGDNETKIADRAHLISVMISPTRLRLGTRKYTASYHQMILAINDFNTRCHIAK
jgi:hypothetical protein